MTSAKLMRGAAWKKEGEKRKGFRESTQPTWEPAGGWRRHFATQPPKPILPPLLSLSNPKFCSHFFATMWTKIFVCFGSPGCLVLGAVHVTDSRRMLAKAILSEGALKASVTKNIILYPCFAIFQCDKKGSTYATVQGVVGTSSTNWPSRVTEENPTEPSTQATSQYLNSNRYKLFTASQCGRSVSFHLSPASESVGTSTSICASSPGP